MPKRKSEDTEMTDEENMDIVLATPGLAEAIEKADTELKNGGHFLTHTEVFGAPQEFVPEHPYEGFYFHFDGSWWFVQDSKRVYVQSVWDLPCDREVVTVTQEEFDALA